VIGESVVTNTIAASNWRYLSRIPIVNGAFSITIGFEKGYRVLAVGVPPKGPNVQKEMSPILKAPSRPTPA
jgi:hypothetical protein